MFDMEASLGGGALTATAVFIGVTITGGLAG